MNTYQPNNIVRVTVTFTDTDGNNTDPTDVACFIRQGAQPQESVTPQKEAVGIYYYDLEVLVPGYYYYKFEGTGALVAAAEGYLFVSNTAFST